MRERLLFVGMAVFLLGMAVVWFTRFFDEMGAGCQENKFVRWCRCKRKYHGENLTFETAAKVFGAALLIRLLIYLAGLVICTQFVEYYKGLEEFTLQDFLGSWKRWDSTHYINLAQKGYDGYIENGQHLFLVFFPLYPWVVRIFQAFIPSWEAAGLFVSTLAFCIGSVFFYGAIMEEYGKEIAKRSFLLLSFYPYAFFFGGIMSESLFFCLLAAGFFCIRRHNWLAAGIIGAFCSMCRIQGILLMGVGFVEFFVAYRPLECLRQKKFGEFVKELFRKGSFLLLTLVGYLVYLGINKNVEGDWFRFRVYQKEHWYHTTTFVADCVDEIIYYISNADVLMKKYVWIPELVIFIVAMLLLLYSIRRHPLRYSAFLFVYTIVNYSVTFLISGGRYMACALTLFLFLAEWAVGRKILYYMVLIIFVCLMGFYFHGFMSGQQVL